MGTDSGWSGTGSLYLYKLAAWPDQGYPEWSKKMKPEDNEVLYEELGQEGDWSFVVN